MPKVLAHKSHQGFGIPDFPFLPLSSRAKRRVARGRFHNQVNFFLGKLSAFDAGSATDGPQDVEPVKPLLYVRRNWNPTNYSRKGINLRHILQNPRVCYVENRLEIRFMSLQNFPHKGDIPMVNVQSPTVAKSYLKKLDISMVNVLARVLLK